MLAEDIPVDLTPTELNRLGADIANEVARLGKVVAEYEINNKAKEKAYKKALAMATVLNKDRGTPTIVKALAETAAEVIAAGNEWEQTEALLIMGKAELSGRESQYQMVKKITDLRIQELRVFRG